MNERIRELAEQTGIEIEFDDYGEVRLSTAYGSTLEKFAELIVRECVDKMESEDSFYGEWMGEVIKEHFGVEEPRGWICPKCGVDRCKESCPSGYNSLLSGQCPMVGVAQ